MFCQWIELRLWARHLGFTVLQRLQSLPLTSKSESLCPQHDINDPYRLAQQIASWINFFSILPSSNQSQQFFTLLQKKHLENNWTVELVWSANSSQTKKVLKFEFSLLGVFSISTMDIYDVYRDLYAPLSSGRFGCNLLKDLFQLQRSPLSLS